MKNRVQMLTALIVLSVMTLASCGGNKAFTRGSYDKDVNDTNLLNDRWSESDMQNAVKALVKSAGSHYAIRSAKVPPVVMVTGVQNKTEEHIDTQSVTDMVRVELMRNGRLQFVDKAARDSIAEEYKYQNSGMVSKQTKKGAGGQVGADYILNGRLDSIVQQAGRDKTVYYKVTLNMTNLKTGLIVWSDYKQIRKKFHKNRFGL